MTAIDPLDQAALWLDAGERVALATVVATWGSAPRPVGGQLALTAGGAFAGSVSGGCVEGAVIEAGVRAIADGAPRRLSFGVADDDARAVGLACGGEISVFVEPVAPDGAILRALNAARAARKPAALVTGLADGAQRLLVDGEAPLGPLALEADMQARAIAQRGVDASGFLDDAQTLFVRISAPPARLAIVGAAHIAQALAPMAAALDYAPTVIDPRGGWAAPERFPGVPILDDWPDDALAAFDPDMRTAVVCLTHDPKLDDPALIAALASPAFYIGALGSRRTHAKRLDRLAGQGVAAEDAARIHGPVGLAIGAKTPAEIAVAIMGQITAARRGAAAA